MKGIYDKFPARLEELQGLGTEAEKMTKVDEGCMALVFRHASAVVQPLAQFSEQVGTVVPTMVYAVPNFQTTILPYGISDYYRYDSSQAEAAELLARAAMWAIDSLEAGVVNRRLIEFGPLLFSRGVILAPGYPSYEQWLLLNAVVEQAKQTEGLDTSKFRMPWGSQCVVARYLADVSADELGDLFRLIEQAPVVGSSRPEAIEVIVNEVDQGVQTTTTLYRLELP